MPINPHYQDNTSKFDKPKPDVPRPADFPRDDPQKDIPYAEDPKKKRTPETEPEDYPEGNPGYTDNDRGNLA